MPCPELSLIVPAYNEARRIRHTLEAMRSYLAARGLAYTVKMFHDDARQAGYTL